MWNLIGRQAKISRFLHLNDHPERRILYLVRQFVAQLAKLGHIFTIKGFTKIVEKIAFNEICPPNLIFK